MASPPWKKWRARPSTSFLQSLKKRRKRERTKIVREEEKRHEVMNVTLSDLLKKMLDMSGSDLHITTNSPPQVRVHGHLQPLDMPPMTPSETKQLAYSVLTDAQKHRFEETLELDFSFGLNGLPPFPANCFTHPGAVGAVYRVIPFEIKTFQQLKLTQMVS